MIVIYVSITKPEGAYTYDGFQDCIDSAERFSGCPVIVLTDEDQIRARCKYKLPKYEPSETPDALGRFSIDRWRIILAFAKEHPWIWPTFAPDRDCLIFSKLTESCGPFFDCDFATFKHGSHFVNPTIINRIEPIMVACELKGNNDIEIWNQVAESGKWNVRDMGRIVNGSVFDDGMHQQTEHFTPKTKEDGSKIIVWNNGRPHFMSTNGDLIRAHTIHCWGSYKTRTKELLDLATLHSKA